MASAIKPSRKASFGVNSKTPARIATTTSTGLDSSIVDTARRKDDSNKCAPSPKRPLELPLFCQCASNGQARLELCPEREAQTSSRNKKEPEESYESALA